MVTTGGRRGWVEEGLDSGLLSQSRLMNSSVIVIMTTLSLADNDCPVTGIWVDFERCDVLGIDVKGSLILDSEIACLFRCQHCSSATPWIQVKRLPDAVAGGDDVR